MNLSDLKNIFTDEELCVQAASGDCTAEEALVLRYSRLVRICARPFFLAGGDSEDLIQEGMLGLLSAIREYRPERNVRFRSFAELCIRRRIISAVRSAAGGKHQPLNNGVSLEPFLFQADGEREPLRVSSLRQENPEDVMIHREALSSLETALSCQLTGLERQVLALYLEGLSYLEIAGAVHRTPKSVDNAVQRIRRKTARYLSGEYSES